MRKAELKQFVREVIDLAKPAPRELLRVRFFLALRAWASFLFRTRVLQKLRVHEDPSRNVAANAIEHNLRGLGAGVFRAFSAERPDQLLRPLSVVQTIDRATAQVLMVGPRADSELDLITAYGFRHENVRGLDLITYSSRVDLGDMHQTPYVDDRFDVVILGWVLAYSEDPGSVVREMIRICRPGATVALGVQSYPLSNEEIAERIGYVPGASRRLDSLDDILALFGDHVDDVYFRHDVRAALPDQASDMMAVLRIRKPA